MSLVKDINTLRLSQGRRVAKDKPKEQENVDLSENSPILSVKL